MGQFKELNAIDLATFSTKEVLTSSGINPSIV